jgi:hypothetical protein
MAHTRRCSNARTDRCNCSCNGALHGGTTSLVRVLAVLRATDPTGSSDRQSADVRRRREHTKFRSRANAELESWLASVAASPPDSVSAVTLQNVGMVSDAVAAAVVNALHRNGYRWTDADHVICDFLAAAAHVMQEVQDRLSQAVTHMVSAILTARQREGRPAIPQPLATVAAQAAVNALTNLSAVRQFDDLLRATRILAIITCPAPEDHRAVIVYCLKPLEKGLLSDAIRQEIMNSLPRRLDDL